VELGANGLALGPVFSSATHGYDTLDHFAVDPRLGSEDDLVQLIEQSHRRGIRVQLDGVFNHVGRDFPAFIDVVAKREKSQFAEWFLVDFEAAGEAGFGYRNFEGHDALVALNHDNPEVSGYVAEVMTYWCDRGVDSWRLDAAYAVPPAFWSGVLARVRAAHPEVWVSGEMIHGDYAAYVAESGIDSVTQYELWKAVWSSLNDRNLFELSHALTRHAALLQDFVPQTFIGNHDVTRIASRLQDPRHLPLAVALLLLAPGVPSIYYGDEQGYCAVKEERVGGDDAIRPAYPPTPAELDPQGAVVHDLHRQLVSVRRRHPGLADATALTAQPVSNEVMTLRIGAADRLGSLVLNVGDEPAIVTLPVAAAHLEAGAATVHQSDGGQVQVEVPPHQFAFLSSL
jgi:cyclomaltodextrinase